MRIGDFVWHDTNANGVQDGGESPLQGVTVELYTSGGTLVKSTTTDASGLWTLTSYDDGLLPSTQYEIRLPISGVLADYEPTLKEAPAADSTT